ncbi:MAG: kinase/pyrophosphorylase [Candidatus Sericytochromatia bacterium]|nr:kinase/pyrophosphorylase [Candidatus Sericytochromatia bacterium]
MSDQMMTVYSMSDSTGQTAETLSKAAIRQFRDVQDIRHIPLPRISRAEQIDKIVTVLAQTRPCMIAYTLSVPSLQDVLIEKAAALDVPVVNLLDPLVQTIAQQLGTTPPRREDGILHHMDEEYYSRIDAVEFAIRFDDGKDPKGMALADIILVGVSRTSKTPTCMYLAQNYGKKVTNNPIVYNLKPPKELFENKDKVVGLIVRPEVLLDIRSARLHSLGLPDNSPYANADQVQRELDYARQLMDKLGCPVVDVSHKAIEETATEIIYLRYPKPITSRLQAI